MIGIDPTSEHPQLVAQLAEAFAIEWPEWASTLTSEALEATFACGPAGDLPVVLVAYESGRALGTVALRRWFGDDAMPESPWIRGFYVAPAVRGRGIDRLLLDAAEREARRRGFATLYGATTRIETLAVRRGWRVFRRIDHHGEPMAWMRKPVG